MKSKVFIALIMFCCVTTMTFAQKNTQKRDQNKDRTEINKNRTEKRQAELVGYITRQIDLTPAEAEKFWPLYNEMQTKKKELRKPFQDEMKSQREARKNGGEASDKDYQKLVALSLDYKVKDAELNKKYYEKFGKILPAEKVFKLERSSAKMNKKAADRMELRANKEMRKGGKPDKNRQGGPDQKKDKNRDSKG